MTDIVSPPTIDAMPPAPQPTDTREQFNLKAFPHAAAQQTMVTQVNASNQATYQNAVAADERAVAASASATTATQQADAAMAYRNTANNAATTATQQAGIATSAAGTASSKRDEAVAARDQAVPAADTAVGARDAAVAARDQAQVFATQQIKASSATSLVPGAGNKTFAIEANRSFVAGMYLVATSAGVPGTRMSGYVVSYDMATGQLVLAVDSFAGPSARADWLIGVAAPGGGGGAGMTVQVVTANTQCLANVNYVIAAPNIVLTLPTAWNSGDRIGFSEAIGYPGTYTLDFGSTPLRGATVGVQSVRVKRSGRASLQLTYLDNSKGLV